MKKYGLPELMIRRFIEVVIDQRYRLAARDPVQRLLNVHASR
ncbi:hypothetical protein VSR68_38995 [Paraburkholderia phymatum]